MLNVIARTVANCTSPCSLLSFMMKVNEYCTVNTKKYAYSIYTQLDKSNNMNLMH